MRKKQDAHSSEQLSCTTPDGSGGADVPTSARRLLTPTQAAAALGIERTTFYGWIGLARRGLLILRGRRFELAFRQTGAAGQGRILIEAGEIERLQDHLLVRPQLVIERRPRTPTREFPGIHVPLGRPT